MTAVLPSSPAPAPHLRVVPDADSPGAPVALLVLTQDGRLLAPTPEQLAPLAKLLPAVLAAPQPAPGAIVLGRLTVRPDSHVAEVDGERLPLTVREFEVLAELARAEGRTLSREHLLDAVWGGADRTGLRSVDVHVARLRAKLAAVSTQLVTVRGRGYRLDAA